MPLATLLGPSVAITNPVCLPATGDVVTVNCGLTVCPAEINTVEGTLAPATLLDRLTVTPPAGAAVAKYTCPVGYGVHPPMGD